MTQEWNPPISMSTTGPTVGRITTTGQFAVADAILFLNTLADRLDRWATESKSGGWSTHQVQANTHAADECRRMAARLRSANP